MEYDFSLPLIPGICRATVVEAPRGRQHQSYDSPFSLLQGHGSAALGRPPGLAAARAGVGARLQLAELAELRLCFPGPPSAEKLGEDNSSDEVASPRGLGATAPPACPQPGRPRRATRRGREDARVTNSGQATGRSCTSRASHQVPERTSGAHRPGPP